MIGILIQPIKQMNLKFHYIKMKKLIFTVATMQQTGATETVAEYK